jgi:ATP synthase protein I
MSEHEEHSGLDDLDTRIRAAREREVVETKAEPGRRQSSSGIAMGMRISVEFVAGVAVGVGIGWGLDHLLGTKPLLMVLFLLLGGGAGVMNAYRAAKGLDATVGLGAAQRRQAKQSKDT